MAMNQRVQKILLELMRERHSLYAGFTDVELKSILKSHAGDVSACHATIQGLQDADGGTGDAGAFDRGAKRYRTDGAEEERGGGEPSKKKRHRPSRDRARERIERRVPLTREGVDSLDWNEACEYAKSMGVSKKSHTTRDATRRCAVVRTAPHEGYSSDEADDHPRPPRVVAADTIEPSSDDDDEADATPPLTDAHTDEQRDIARLMVAGVAGGRP
ncbi:hypothetical protein JL720_10389 [Aureococcus anophagefferens]|nr:hypothetical protein JL720_10389 [Aureococcus anophagefferens]